MDNGKMPAMPLPLGTETEKWCQGITKREMMAMHIMCGMQANADIHLSSERMAEDDTR